MSLTRSNLHNYQNRIINFIFNNLKSALWVDLGFGKTVCTLTALSDLFEEFAVTRVIITAPLRVSNTVWKQEIKEWDHLKHLKAVICTGTEKQRLEALNSDAQIYVINRENIPWLAKTFRLKRDWKWDGLVIDEATSFKSSKSQRFKALKKIIDRFDLVLELTATPAPNGYEGLWSQMFLLDKGERLGKTKGVFMSRYFVPDGYMGYNHKFIESKKEELMSSLSDITLTMIGEDYLEVPKRIDLYEKIEMPKKVRDQYKEMEDEFVLELKDEVITASSAAVKINKLLQVCSGSIYDEEGKGHVIHDEKLNALEELLERLECENVLLAYNFKTDLDRIKSRFKSAVELDKKGRAVEKWNQGKIRLLLAHPASAGHGLNLQRGGSVIIWFGVPWSLELYQQFIGRLERQGQTNVVRNIHLVVKDSVEEKVVKVLSEKHATQRELLDRLKAKL